MVLLYKNVGLLLKPSLKISLSKVEVGTWQQQRLPLSLVLHIFETAIGFWRGDRKIKELILQSIFKG